MQSIKRALGELLGQIMTDIKRVLVTQPVEHIGPLLPDGPGPSPKKLPTLASHETQADLRSPGFPFPNELDRLSDDVGIERAAEAAVARHHHHLHKPIPPFLQQGM